MKVRPSNQGTPRSIARWGALTVGAALLGLWGVPSAQAADATAVTFSKDVAPILQAKCQTCHRPDGGAPFSMLTYDAVRPWARSIQRRVEAHTMPPWFIDSRVGIANQFLDDPSLTEAEIATINQWVAAGAPQGDPADMPAPRQFPASDEWDIGGGTPDLVITPSEDFTMYAKGNDVWWDDEVDAGLTEDMWVKELQVLPGSTRIVHHVVLYAISPKVDPDAPQLIQGGSSGEITEGAGQDSGAGTTRQMLYTFVPGRTPSRYTADAGMLLRKGTKIAFAFHYAASGKEETDHTQLGLVFFKKGDEPKHRVLSTYFSVEDEKIDIAPNSQSRIHAYYALRSPTKIVSWTPHMHQRGHSQVLQAILPNGRVQTLAKVDNYDFGWQITYTFDNDVAPLLPQGTMLHIDVVHDNTPANRTNPDPSRWVGYGQASTDEMAGAFLDIVQYDQGEFNKLVAARRASEKTPTRSQQ